MADLLGWTMLALGLALVSCLARARPAVAMPLLAAFALRAAAALSHYYLVPLPDGTADAPKFEAVAWLLAEAPGLPIDNFDYTASYSYSLLMAHLYMLTDRSPLMLQALSVLVGSLCVYLTWRIVAEGWSEAIARPAAWITALFPMAIMYSALTMREVYFTLFLLLGLLLAQRWLKQDRLIWLVGAFAAMVIGCVFHFGMIAAIAVLALFVATRAVIRGALGLVRGRIDLFALAVLVLVPLVATVLLIADPRLPKFGNVSTLFTPERYLGILEHRMSGDAAYPEWMAAHDGLALIWAIPFRSLYLLFSPMPFDVGSLAHLAGLVDAMLYLALVVAAVFSLMLPRNRAFTFLLALVLIALVITFGVGTGNFGTALRHRVKFAFVLVAMAAPAMWYLGELLKRPLRSPIITPAQGPGSGAP